MNIVTIDMDIIMEPSINLYNDLIGEESEFSNYIDEYEFIANVPANLYIYEYLTRFITKVAAQTKANIYFISDHNEIVDIIRKNKDENDEITIYNVDHHHDIGYEIENWFLPLMEHNVGNWIKYLKDKKLIKKYHWIYDAKSTPLEEDDDAYKYLDSQTELKNFDLEDMVETTDAIVICSSYDWIPPVYRPLFLNWNTICSEVRGEDYPL